MDFLVSSRWALLSGLAVMGMLVIPSNGCGQVRLPDSISKNAQPTALAESDSEPENQLEQTDKPEGQGQAKSNSVGEKAMNEKAILAGGCFWGMEDLFRNQTGVISTRCGYTGGNVKNATYQNHGTHAEAIEVIFDPSQTNFRQLLEFFFQIHDPTTLNRQGNDRGTSYRSGIYYTSEEQKRSALDTIEEVNTSGLWPGKVVTEVKPAADFWEAEAVHQDYLVRNPNGYTCHYPRKKWVLPKRAEATE